MKKIIKNPSVMLRILLGLIFLSAGSFRVIWPSAALAELASLQLPQFLAVPLMIFEITMGLALIFNRYVKVVYIILFVFMIGAICHALILGGSALWLAAGELFVFNINPTDIFMHLVFAFILLYLFLVTNHDKNLKEKKEPAEPAPESLSK